MKSFEVQIQRAGLWQGDSVYDDRDAAEQRALQYESSRQPGRHHGGVRVIEEVFVERTQKYMTRTVYRDTKFQEAVQAKLDISRQARAQTANAGQPHKRDEPEMTPGHWRTPPASMRKALTGNQLFGIFALLVGLGIGALIALEYFQMAS